MSISRSNVNCYMTLTLLPKAYDVYKLIDYNSKEEFLTNKGFAIMLYRSSVQDMILLDSIKIPFVDLDKLEWDEYMDELGFVNAYIGSEIYDKDCTKDFTVLDSGIFTTEIEKAAYFKTIQIFSVLNVVATPFSADAYSEISRLLKGYSDRDLLPRLMPGQNPNYFRNSKDYFLDVLPSISEKFANDELDFDDYDYIIAYCFLPDNKNILGGK